MNVGYLKLTLILLALTVMTLYNVGCALVTDIMKAGQLNTQVEELYGKGRYKEAIPLAQELLVIDHRIFGPAHPGTAIILMTLAGLYRSMDAYPQAESMYKRALAVREETLGPRHPDTVASLINLAGLYVSMGAHDRAEPLIQRVFTISEKTLGPEHPDTATSLSNLARLYHLRGAYSEAEPLYQRALVIREKTLGPEHPDTVTSLDDLAKLYVSIGAYDRAESLVQRVFGISEKTLGSEHPDMATSLSSLAGLYHLRGAYSEAEPLYQRALAIREKTLGHEHPDTATSLNNLAGLYVSMGAYDQAEPLVQRALAISEKTLGHEHPDTATSLYSLARLYRSMGDYSEAEPLLQRALAVSEKVLGPEHPDTAASLNSLAMLYESMGAYAKAEPLLQRALAISEKALGLEHSDTANSLNNLGSLYESMGVYAKAEPLLQRALTIKEKALGPEHPGTAISLSNLALLYSSMGAYAQVEPLFQRALAIRKKALGPEHPDTAISLSNLGSLYESMGVYAKAEPLLQRALEITEKALGPEHPNTAISFDTLALLYWSMGAYAQVEPLYQRALAIREKALGSEHPDTAMSLYNLGSLYESMGAYSEAEALQHRALAIREKVLGPEHPDTAASLNNLALLYSSMGAYTQVEPLYQRALAIREKVLGPEHPDTAISLNNLAILYRSMGAYSEAEALHHRALALNEKALGPEHPNTATSLNNLAILFWAQGQWKQAFGGLSRAAQILEGNARQILGLGDESRKRAFAQTLVGTSAAAVTFSLAARQIVPDAESFGMEVIMQRKGLVLDTVADIFGAIKKSMAPEDQQLFSRWQDVNGQYATLAFQEPEQMTTEQYVENLHQLDTQAGILENALSKRSAQFRRQLEPVTLERVQRAIPAGAALIEWFRYQPFIPRTKDEGSRRDKPRYIAFILKHVGKPIAVDVGEAAVIETAVGDLLVALKEQHATVAEIGRDLDDKLMQPLRRYLGDATQWLISPDGQLNLLPFGVLTDNAGRYVLQTVEISYLTSGRDLLRLTDTVTSRQASVIFANPDYGPLKKVVGSSASVATNRRSVDMRDGRQQFLPLEGTEQEALAIKGVLSLKDEQVLTGVKASEAAVKQLKGPRILHLATHGFFLQEQHNDTHHNLERTFGSDAGLAQGENPLLRSGLALAGANQLRSGDDDGILTALEVSGLELVGTELAVLSACETGLGQVQNGEGVYGLRRALVLAGVQSQVVSLWKVSDTATRDLMVDYYSRLSEGVGHSQALRAAQLAMMNDPKRAHPYYWAAFVAIGNPGVDIQN